MPTPQPLSWAGVRPNPVEKTVILDESWTGVITVKVFTKPDARLLSTLLQPVVSKTGNVLFVKFNNTAAISNSSWVQVLNDATVVLQGYMTLSSIAPEVNPNEPEPVESFPSILTPEMIEGLPALLGKKAEVVYSVSPAQTLAAQTGGSKFIFETIAGKLVVYSYSPTAVPPLDKILTYN